MREHRWESQSALSLDQILNMTDRLRKAGLTPADPDKDVITYIEEWEVSDPKDILKLDLWPIEDVTLTHILENWEGDFFLLVGRYHTVFQRYQSVNTYCSVCHPWQLEGHLATLLPDAMFWVGFRRCERCCEILPSNALHSQRLYSGFTRTRTRTNAQQIERTIIMRGSLKKRYKGSWNIVLDLGTEIDPNTGKKKRKQKWITVTGTKRAAERELTKLLNDVQKGEYIQPCKMTLGE